MQKSSVGRQRRYAGRIWAGFGAGGARKLAQERAGELRKVGVEMGGRGFRRGTGPLPVRTHRKADR